MDQYQLVANIMKVLGHPVRLHILRALQEGEACVCHLEAVLGQRQAYISQQLMRLRTAGLVTDRREDLFVYYALANENVAHLIDLAQQVARTVGDEKITFQALQAGVEVGCGCPQCQKEAITT